MHGEILRYGAASVVPALASVAALYAFTRLLSPGAFGDYSLAFGGVMIGQSLSYALATSVARLFPEAERRADVAGLCRAAYAVQLSLVVAFAACAPIFSFLGDGVLGSFILIPVLLLLRGIVTVNQAVTRMTGRAGRYVAVECGHAMVGVAAGLALIMLVGPTALSVLAGLAVSAALFALLDARLMVKALAAGRLDRDTLRVLVFYALPLAATHLTAALLLQIDRFVIGGLGSAQMLGTYVVAISLVERPTGLLCSAVATATYPLAIRALESQGADAGQRQAGLNAMALVGLTLPACVGIALGGRHVAAFLIGSMFRDGVVVILPLVCATAFLRGVSTHVLDQAFQLGRRAKLLPCLYLPAAALHLLGSAALLPVLRLPGAVLSALLCQIGLIACQVLVCRRVFPILVPWGEIAKVALATSVMGLVIAVTMLPVNAAGLAELIAVGGAAYAATLFVTDGLGLRAWVWSTVRSGLSSQGVG